jgi:hypothetical protein
MLHLEKRQRFISHYSFHIMDPQCGHVTIKDVRASALRRADHPQAGTST